VIRLEARMDFLPNEHEPRAAYRWLTQLIVPRPIGWISTVSPDGINNLAPYSFFNAISSNPPLVVFAPGMRRKAGEYKDTFNNVISTKEFVVNLVTEELAEAMNLTAREFPHDVDEFEQAGLTPAASKLVSVPHVAESPAHLECRLDRAIALGDPPGQVNLIVGEVLLIHVDDDVLDTAQQLDLEEVKLIGRLGGHLYSRLGDRFKLKRL
jgi:flavin reductase (DIM6/NTAB) family NADH-FMN oxidoreductase RutF